MEDLPNTSTPTWDDLRRWGRQQLAALPDGIRDADWLLCHALQVSRSQLLTHPEQQASATATAQFRQHIAARAAGQPVAYLVESQGFWSLTLRVTPAVLIPRPDTELLVECAAALVGDDRDYWGADVGTGSGAIALALAVARPRLRLYATDVSAAALAVAQHNVRAHGLHNRIVLLPGDLCAPLPLRRLDFIASNPPYLAADDPHLPSLGAEPRLALVAAQEGLANFARLAAQARRHLCANGTLLLEHGYQQGAAVRAILAAAGYVAIHTVRDLARHERVTCGVWP